MKRIFLKSAYILGLTAMSAIAGCSGDFLEVEPKGKLIAKKTNDYHLLLNNLDLLNVNTDTQIPLGDEIAAVEPWLTGGSLRTQRLFRYEADVYEPNEDNPEIVNFMKQVYLYNKVINEVMNSTEGTEEKKRSLRAEALAGRAWCYFMMAGYFGKPYDPATAGTDLAVPIYKKSDVTESGFTRATVKEVYDFIVADLREAIPDLPPRIFWRLRMSKAAGEGLLAKVYLHMGRYPEALAQLNAAFADLAGAEVPVRLYDYNVTLAPGGAFLPIGLFGPAAPLADAFEETLYAKNVSNTWAFISSELVISPETRDLYNDGDLRLKLFSPAPFGSPSYGIPRVMRRTGYPGSVMPFGVTLADMTLMRAECKARTNDLAGAATELVDFRKHRMPEALSAIPAGMTQRQLIDYIINGERVREFAVTGHRWFDMRRMSADPLFRDKTYKHRVYAENGNATETDLKPERLVIRFGRRLMDMNPGMPNNP